ncbi:DnaJ domain-containing protein [Campylobacter sp. 9BO]|uniref:DnaJ domain-containing protein n=1 Tax=Campylobacter sp. 9BO TaxID=3424759 RepID=UPI003D33638D
MLSFLFYLFIFWLIFKFAGRIFGSLQGGFGGNFSGINFRQASQDEAKFLTALLAKVAKGDGRVSELEAQLISEIFDDLVAKTGVSRAELKAVFDTEKELVDEAYDVAREYKLKFRLSQQIAIARITFFLNLAYIDGEFGAGERRVIEQIARGFDISNSVLDMIIARFERFYTGSRYQNSSNSSTQSRAKDPYEVLEISRSASFSDVKKRYRELVKKYHPDILMGQGESEAVIEKSTKKLQEINEAYESIKKERDES